VFETRLEMFQDSHNGGFSSSTNSASQGHGSYRGRGGGGNNGRGRGGRGRGGHGSNGGRGNFSGPPKHQNQNNLGSLSKPRICKKVGHEAPNCWYR
jgi:hypothetical protein